MNRPQFDHDGYAPPASPPSHVASEYPAGSGIALGWPQSEMAPYSDDVSFGGCGPPGSEHDGHVIGADPG
jgi:hypothetical protein